MLMHHKTHELDRRGLRLRLLLRLRPARVEGAGSHSSSPESESSSGPLRAQTREGKGYISLQQTSCFPCPLSDPHPANHPWPSCWPQDHRSLLCLPPPPSPSHANPRADPRLTRHVQNIRRSLATKKQLIDGLGAQGLPAELLCMSLPRPHMCTTFAGKTSKDKSGEV